MTFGIFLFILSFSSNIYGQTDPNNNGDETTTTTYSASDIANFETRLQKAKVELAALVQLNVDSPTERRNKQIEELQHVVAKLEKVLGID